MEQEITRQYALKIVERIGEWLDDPKGDGKLYDSLLELLEEYHQAKLKEMCK